MFKEKRDEIVEELLFDLAFHLTDNELAGMVADSNCHTWGEYNHKNLHTWNIDDNEIGFSVDLYMSGELEEDRHFFFDKIWAKIEGIAIFNGEKWEVSEYKILNADMVFDNVDAQLDAIESNIDPFQTFTDEIKGLKLLNSLEIVDSSARKILYKQTFVGIITCLETYLSDTFINKVLSNEMFLGSFYSNFDFRGETIKFSELLEYSEKVETAAKEKMLGILYHRLPQVSEIFKKVIGIKFPDFSEINKAISRRHDIVHRNGKTKDGKEISVNYKDIEELIIKTESFVSEIDEDVKSQHFPTQIKYKPEINF